MPKTENGVKEESEVGLTLDFQIRPKFQSCASCVPCRPELPFQTREF
jgi:hypothetical protein